jgi:hypothetical protein
MPIQMGSNEEDRYSGERLAVNPATPNVIYFGSRENGLWISRDHAQSWSQVTSFPVSGPVLNSEGLSDGVIFVKFGPPLGSSKHLTIYAGVSAHANNLFTSRDNGASWQPIAGAPTGITPTNAALGSDGNLYLTYCDLPGPNSVGSGLGAVYKYNTVTGAWINVTPLGPYDFAGPFWYGFANVVVDPHNPLAVMVTTMDAWYPGDNLMRSTDGGATWNIPRACRAIRPILQPTTSRIGRARRGSPSVPARPRSAGGWARSLSIRSIPDMSCMAVAPPSGRPLT